MIKKILFSFFVISLSVFTYSQTDQEIRATISKFQPLKGGVIPQDLKHRLGTTHTGGKYHLTNEPYIIEGANKIEELGMGVIKIFITRTMQGLPYNSEWNLTEKSTYVDVVKHPYFQEVLNKDFSTVILNVSDHDGELLKQDADFSVLKSEIYDLGVYLLKEYKDKDITFILKNWEGDWVLRGGSLKKQAWQDKGAAFHNLKVRNFIAWTKSRQQAVTKARKKVKDTKAKLFLAVEANKVMESQQGFPGVANSVLPKVEVDMVSWSCYDGMGSPVALYKGIEYLRTQMKPTSYMKGKKSVFLGEIGIPERKQPENITKRWDEFLGVCFALDLPYIIHWELYCNEPVDNANRKKYYPIRTEEEMRGFWLIKPDGTKGEACNYFERLLKAAGSTLSAQ